MQVKCSGCCRTLASHAFRTTLRIRTNNPRRAALCRKREIEALPGMTGNSASLQRVCRLARLVAPRQTTVLLTGETGTGKELVARALHVLSPRRDQPFVVINCAAIPEALLEAEMFGYNRGAFTGAFQSRMGRMQLAHGGTRLCSTKSASFRSPCKPSFCVSYRKVKCKRLGSSDSIRIDARVIAATNANLRKMVKARSLPRRPLLSPGSLPRLKLTRCASAAKTISPFE